MLTKLRLIVSLFISALLCVQPAMAQSILRDAETETFFAEISLPIIKAAELSPGNVRIALIGDKSINAFTAGGQIGRASCRERVCLAV